MRIRSVVALTALAAIVAAPLPSTAESGAIWAATMPATGDIDRLSAFPDGTYYTGFAQGYARSRDYGRTWEPMPQPRPGGTASAVRFGTPTHGYALASPGLHSQLLDDTALGDELKRCGDIMPMVRTTNGGTSWSAVCVPYSRIVDQTPHFNADPWQFAVGRDGRTVVLGGTDSRPGSQTTDCGKVRGVIATSRDGGVRWNRAALPAGWQGGIRTYADSAIVAHLAYKFAPGECASSHTGLWVSRDSGKTYTKVYDCGPPACTAFTAVTRTRWLLGRSDGTVIVSDNAGRTWRKGQRLFDARWQPAIDSGQMAPAYFWVQGFSFANAKVGYASTRGVGTWRTTDGGTSWQQEKSHECAWYQWGIGESSAATVDNAMTGGPAFISSRVVTPAPTEGCGATQPQVPSLVGGLVATNPSGALSLRLDGSLVAGTR